MLGSANPVRVRLRRVGRRSWCTGAVSTEHPARRPDAPAGPPRWLLVLLAAGLSLLLAASALLALDAAGVESVSQVGFFAVVVAAALAGGGLTRLLGPRLPPVRRPPRS